MNKDLSVLFVSIAFPPKNDPEAIQTGKMVKYLVRENLSIKVVTSAIPTLNMPYDEDLEPYTKGVKDIVSIALNENRYLNFLKRKLGGSFVPLPDYKNSFAKYSGQVVSGLKERPNIIYSRSFPLSSTIMGLRLKQQLPEIPWVLHLSDPWSNSPIHDYSDRESKFHSESERLCFDQASAITMTSEATLDAYKKMYPEYSEKFRYMPNVYDPEEITTEDYSLGSKLRMVYSGGLSNTRSPGALLTVLKELEEQFSDLGERLEVILVGPIDRKYQALIEDFGLKSLSALGAKSYSEALKVRESADVLVVIDTPQERKEDAVFFPSKLLDYMVGKRKILAITDSFSVTSSVVDEDLGVCFEHGDTEGIKEFFLTALEAHKEGNTSFFKNNIVPERFSAETNARKLKELFEELI